MINKALVDGDLIFTKTVGAFSAASVGLISNNDSLCSFALFSREFINDDINGFCGRRKMMLARCQIKLVRQYVIVTT